MKVRGRDSDPGRKIAAVAAHTRRTHKSHPPAPAAEVRLRQSARAGTCHPAGVDLIDEEENVGPHPRDRSQRRQKHFEPDAPEQTLVLGWRESWRTEAAATKRPAQAANHKPDGEEKKRRARFAAGIARSEFGRHYWDARREKT